MRNFYTDDEVILCTYAALYDIDDIGGLDALFRFCKRSGASIKMKIANIASMLDEHGIARKSGTAGLTGVTTGKAGRLTNWPLVLGLTRISHEQLKAKCLGILGR